MPETVQNEMCDGGRVTIKDELLEVREGVHNWTLQTLGQVSQRPDALAPELQFRLFHLPQTAAIYGLEERENGYQYTLPKAASLTAFAVAHFSGDEFTPVRYKVVPGAQTPIRKYLGALREGVLPLATEAELYAHDTIVHAVGAAALQRRSSEVFYELVDQALAEDNLESMILLGDAYDVTTAEVVTAIRGSNVFGLLTMLLSLAEYEEINGKCLGMKAEYIAALRKKGLTIREDAGYAVVLEEMESLADHGRMLSERLGAMPLAA